MATEPPGVPQSFRQLSGGQRKAFFAAWLGYLLDGFDFILITLVLTEIADDFDLDLTTAATLVSAAFVSRWLGGLVLGAIGDRFGRKPAMILAILAFSVGSGLCGFAWGYWSLFVFRAIVGIGMAGEYGSSATYVMESWPKAMRNRATGFLLSAYPIGTVLAALSYEVIVPDLGWRWLFYVGIVPIALALYLRRSLPEAAEWTAEVAGRRDVTTSSVLFTPRRRLGNGLLAAVLATALVLVFSENSGGVSWLLVAVVVAGFVAFAVQLAGRLWPVMLAIMVTVFCAFLYSWPIQSLLPTYLKTELGYDAGQVSNALTWAGLGYAAGSCLAGVLGDRLGTRRAYVLGLFVSLAFVFPVFALPAGNIVLLWVLLFAMQATSQGISGLLPKYIADHFPTRLRAAGLGFSYNVGALGGAVAPLAGAAIAADLGDLGTALTTLAVTLTVTVALIIGFDLPARIGRWLRVSTDISADTPARTSTDRTTP
ncbi:MFS transporter, SHS family, sialic acid transporter [Amycolatopsis arida]|uniref:MFS transporter, SHS family, sialic acid transporter n=1 Tax=Amycolatopsis arida TaxID=587909 RepID=A0A1I5URJ1_9PSEU|nr:sialate:H+ symport family MFS transporter [Amycolatopsis arida]TDX91007.1 SHS family sialic acid transporter-like MFS transporter [Amycolatopsis arida]SFP97812.1 MFS transporter, SHS family, sialic acid transporter [Amycolatopsis arida]